MSPHDRVSLLRKPGYGMLAVAEYDAALGAVIDHKISRVAIDWPQSLMVGDRPEDEACARAAGVPFQWAWQFFGWPDPAAARQA